MDGVPPRQPSTATDQIRYRWDHIPRAPLVWGRVSFKTLPEGVLDDQLAVAAVAQQTNCIWVEGKGLAGRLARKWPYGCPYLDRRRMPGSNFATPEDRPEPGSCDARFPTNPVCGPTVINMFAQWELDPALNLNRVPAPHGMVDSAQQRERWFQECLESLDALPAVLPSIAFPDGIGCGLAWGNWGNCFGMITRWATWHPNTAVTVCSLAGND